MEQRRLRDRILTKLIGPIAYVIPLAASLPPLVAWGGLMTVPFIIYLVMMISNVSVAPPPLPDFTLPWNLFLLSLAGFGLVLLVYSIFHLRREKSDGLVTSGPYRLVRHPQYFALMIFTGIMTLQSVWILKTTFGIGWLTADQTLILWYLMLSAYVVIAWIEEVYLSRIFGDEWKEYRSRVGFLLPLVHFKSSLLEGLVSIILPILVLNLGLPSVFAI